ncbi:MAG: succinyl-diaminopimelate desuccinylase [Propionibacteriaceae bacterium]|jgi:succinyl-diaminopimelate desuccinylase|nr:succinyl-diaminopimelate desuccinylase [Propionibacteriaceae bacterium]
MILPVNDLGQLFAALVDIESVSGNEQLLADTVEQTLKGATHLVTSRDGNTVIARSELGRAQRVVFAGHLDTVPVADNLPSCWTDGVAGLELVGRGSVDMKGGVAVMLRLALALTAPRMDVTWVYYDNEEVAYEANGLGRVLATTPELLQADFAVLLEPTNAVIEGGCQGSIRLAVTVTGRAAHSARSWLGDNAIHAMAAVIDLVRSFPVGEVEVDGLRYREGLNITTISGGVAGNVIPDSCTAGINYRFAPDKSASEALDIMRELFSDYQVAVLDVSPAARPGLNQPIAAQFVALVGGVAQPKYGWTDVARFAEVGIPAVNYGPGEPSLAHTVDEHAPLAQLYACEQALSRWLKG